MLPKLWRYILLKYLQIFSLSIGSFIAILLVSRFKDIARFASVSADWGKTALFMAYQIPNVLPLTVPIAALIATLLLVQNLSRSHELTAFRSSGISLRSLFAPLCFVSLFLSILHFVLCAEITPYCRRESRTLLYRESSANPLLLLQRQRRVKIPGAYLRMKVKEEGKAAHDFVFITYHEAYRKLSLFTARKVHLDGGELLGEEVAFITPIQQGGKDVLLIENQESLAMKTSILTAAMKKNRPSLDATTFGLRMLRIRGETDGKSAQSARIEIWRRISLSLSVFTFTLLGFAFGIELGRSPTKKGTLQAVFLALLLLVSYLLGRTLKQDFILAGAAYFLPHPLIWAYSVYHLYRVRRGTA